MIDKLVMWYFFIGIITCIIGIYRYTKGKQGTEPDELIVLSWFLVWWVWLPYLVINELYKLIYKLIY